MASRRPRRQSRAIGRRGGGAAALVIVLLAGGAPAALGDRPHDAAPPAVLGGAAPAAPLPAGDVVGLAFDAGGALYAADARDGSVVRLGPTGGTLGALGAGRLQHPAGVAVGGDGDVLVADEQGVHRFASGAGADTPVASFPVARPRGLALATDGSIYVTVPDRVLRLSGDGVPLAQWPADDPRGVAVGADGTVWVALAGGVARFRPDGAALGTAPAEHPVGIAAAADGSVLVAEGDRDRVVRLAPDGRRLDAIEGDFAAPRALALDCRGTLAVSDGSPRRIHRIAVSARTAAPCPAPLARGNLGPSPPPAPARAEPDRVVARRPTVVPLAPSAASPAPAAGATALAEPLSGTVLVRRPGGRGVVVLRTATLLQMGTLIDTRDGRLRLTFATRTADFPRLGTAQTADVDSGVFSIHQPRARSAVRLRLEGAGPRCGRAAYGRPLGPRHLWVDVHGDVTTTGLHAHASARDARWLTEDRCEGTLVRVTRGSVRLRGPALRPAVRVDAPAGLLAPPVAH